MMLTLLLITATNPVPVEWNDIVLAIAQAESHGRHAAKGIHGERGAWQITRAAWTDYSNACPKPVPHSKAHDPTEAFLAANWILSDRCHRLSHALGRPPTVQELYAAWNLGMKGFKRRNYTVTHLPAKTKAALNRLSMSILENNP